MLSTMKRPGVDKQEVRFHKGLRCTGQPGQTNIYLRDRK